MSLNYEKVLITGITGLLGSWLAEKLLNDGIDVTGIALDHEKDFLLKSKKLLDRVEISYFDIADEEKIRKHYTTKNFDVVIHLAAQTQVRDALEDPITTFESNIKGTWNLLEILEDLIDQLLLHPLIKLMGFQKASLRGVLPGESILMIF